MKLFLISFSKKQRVQSFIKNTRSFIERRDVPVLPVKALLFTQVTC